MKMLVSKYEAMLLLLLLAATTQSLSASDVIFSEPEQLRVSVDTGRAAVTVSREVTPVTEAPTTSPSTSTTTTPGSNDGGEAATTTTTTTLAPQTSKMTGTIDITFVGVRELDDDSEVSAVNYLSNTNYAIQHVIHRGQKQDTKPLAITSPNINRFSKFFRYRTQW